MNKRKEKRAKVLQMIEDIKPKWIETPTKTIYHRYRHQGMSLREAIYAVYEGTKTGMRICYPHKTIPDLYLIVDL